MATRKKTRVQPGNDAAFRTYPGSTGGVATERGSGSGSIFQPTGSVEAGRVTSTLSGSAADAEILQHLLNTEAMGGTNPSTGLQMGQSTINQNNYGNLLDFLGRFSSDDLTKLFASLGINTGDMNTGQAVDWNKQLLDNSLAQLAEQDKRKYNEGIRDEQRLFDNPLNQLARLMGAGISRDAAIQMLSSGGGSGSGGLVTGDAAALNPGIPASQSALNQTQQQTAIANAAFGGISAVTGLISLGVSIPSAVAQVTALSIQNSLSQKALLGLQSADSVMSALENAVQIGALSTQDIDGFSNATDALNYINDHKDTAAFAPLFQNGSFANVYGTKLGREMFAQAWKNVRSSKDDGTILDNYIKSQRLQNTLTGLQADQIGAEMQKIGAETSAIEQSIIESITRVAEMNANIQVLDKQGKWIDIQSKWQPRVWQADIARTEAETAGLNISNAINQDVFEINHAGVPMLKQAYIDKCELAAYHASTLNSPKAREEFWQAWMLEAENAHAAAFLQCTYNEAVGDFSIEHPHLWKLAQGFSYSGGFDVIKSAFDTGAKAGGAASAAKTVFEFIPK